VDRCAIEKAPLPGKRYKFRVCFRYWVRVEPDPGFGVKKGLPQAVDRNLRHLYPTRSAGFSKIVCLGHVFCIHDRNSQRGGTALHTTVVGVDIAHDVTLILWQVIDFSWDLYCKQILILPSLDSGLPLQTSKQAVVLRNMSSNSDPAL
jgi:hypothetical protein